jgi:hypothetical protein
MSSTNRKPTTTTPSTYTFSTRRGCAIAIVWGYKKKNQGRIQILLSILDPRGPKLPFLCEIITFLLGPPAHMLHSTFDDIRRHSTTFYYILLHSTTFRPAPPRRANTKVFYLQPTSPDTMSNVYDNITRWPQCSENLHLQGAVVIVRMHSGWKRWMQWGPVAENVVATSAATKHPQI